MSRSVSAPSSVTKTSPCWNGFMVPGSTLMYGSSFCMVTRRPREVSRRPRLEAVSPLPREEATPPVTKMCLVMRGDCAKLAPVSFVGSSDCGPPSSNADGLDDHRQISDVRTDLATTTPRDFTLTSPACRADHHPSRGSTWRLWDGCGGSCRVRPRRGNLMHAKEHR